MPSHLYLQRQASKEPHHGWGHFHRDDYVVMTGLFYDDHVSGGEDSVFDQLPLYQTVTVLE